MDSVTGDFREVALPVSIFDALRRELASESGALAAIHALHAAGHSAGVEAAGAFTGIPGEDMGALPSEAFWERVATYLGRRGWGTLQHTDHHEGVGFLSSPDWAEARTTPADDAACSFTTGFLSGFLSRAAGGPLAVLEVDCRGRGDDACRFAFGSEAAIHELYGQLMESGDIEAALARL